MFLSFFLLFLLIVSPAYGSRAIKITGNNLLYMLKILPPIFLLMGLLDVWVPKETMIRFMGKGSGLKGGLIAFVLGSAAAGPLYAAFPFAQVLLRKRASLLNIFIFIGAWSAAKVPPFLLETELLGISFAATKMIFLLPAIIAIAFLTNKFTYKEEELIQEKALKEMG
ncbi:MAG TPA: permease [Firmicutes bacterium]|nr:permease [Bacillota bacterium]